MGQQNIRLGMIYMVLTTFSFASQDMLTRFLTDQYSIYLIVMIRYWGMGFFACIWLMRKPDGFKRVFSSKKPIWQIIRALLFAVEVLVMVTAISRIGLINAPAIFAIVPLMIVALSGPLLGEKIGWRRWASVVIGFIGIMIIIQPGTNLFTLTAILPLLGATLFAFYSILNRYIARYDDTDVSLFYTGIIGLILTSSIGLFFLEPIALKHIGHIAILLCTTVCAQIFILKAYEVAEASILQPLTYFHLPFAFLYGILFFGDVLLPNVALGAFIVVCAGLFSIFRSQQKQQN